MEKHILQGSYWLGLGCTALAVLWKVLVVVKVAPEGFASLRYMTFYKGGLLFLVISLATAACAGQRAPKA
jgi:hypothetical protein